MRTRSQQIPLRAERLPLLLKKFVLSDANLSGSSLEPLTKHERSTQTGCQQRSGKQVLPYT